MTKQMAKASIRIHLKAVIAALRSLPCDVAPFERLRAMVFLRSNGQVDETSFVVSSTASLVEMFNAGVLDSTLKSLEWDFPKFPGKDRAALLAHMIRNDWEHSLVDVFLIALGQFGGPARGQ